MSAPDKDRAVAAITIASEASDASPDERRCVAWSLFNRCALNPDRYGRTIAAVCLKRYQYSEWNADIADNNNLLRVVEMPDDDPVFEDCAQAYDDVRAASLTGGADPTSGATHYWDHSISAPYWADQATVTLKTAKFTFVKDVP